jgi:hypothetical protein
MASFLFQILLFSISVGIVAAIYHGILAYSPVLNWWFRFGQRFEKKWFYDPIWGCVKCIAGQMALWSYLIIVFLGQPDGPGDPFAIFPDSNADAALLRLFGLISSICASIFFAMIFARVITKLENK